MFTKTKQKVDTFVNDRVSGPIKTSVIISCAAFVLSAIALLIAAGMRRAGN